MANEEEFSLKWNDHHSSFFSALGEMFRGDVLSDVTISCGDRMFEAHKLVLSACSPFFKKLLTRRPDLRPIIHLKSVDPLQMEQLLLYIYKGELQIRHDQLGPLIETAKSLQIKGLADGCDEEPGGLGRDGRAAGFADDRSGDAPSDSTRVPPKLRRIPLGDEGTYSPTGPVGDDDPNSVDKSSGPYSPSVAAGPSNNRTDYESMIDIKEENVEMLGAWDEQGGDQNGEFNSTNYDDSVHQEGYLTIENADDASKISAQDGNPILMGLLQKKYAKNHHCQICGKGFVTPSKLQRHMRSHTGERPFVCEFCYKPHSQEENLKAHRILCRQKMNYSMDF